MNVKKADLSHLKPYGDQMDDGAIQLSFTLPIPYNRKAFEAAKRTVEAMNLQDVQVVFAKDLGENFTFFVVYAHAKFDIDYNEIKILAVESERMDLEEVDKYVEENVGRKIVVVGATIGTDAHTVGLDSILNMKGYHGDSGLERYKMFEVHNLGSQVSPSELVRKVRETKADVVLISQIVTQRNIHVKNMLELVDMLEAEGLRKSVLLIAGGPRISHELAIELGYDAGFGAGTLPSEVASYVATQMAKKVS